MTQAVCTCHGKIVERLESLTKSDAGKKDMWDAINSKVSLRLFMWVIGILFSLTLFFFGQINSTQNEIKRTVSTMQTQIAVNAETLKQIEKRMQGH